MLELKGKYNKDCKIFIDEVEPEALSLIQSILDQRVSESVPIRIMPDVHTGKGIVIGFTMPLTDMLNPSHIGVDIGCGIACAKFSRTTSMDLEKIDKGIRERVPMGFELHDHVTLKNIAYDEVNRIADIFTKKYNERFGTSYIPTIYSEKWLDETISEIGIDHTKIFNAIGSLGGGNHFVEIGKDTKGDYWITIHSGSRNFGLRVAEYWISESKKDVFVASEEYNKELDDIRFNTRDKNSIPEKIKKLKERYSLRISKEFLHDKNLFCYLEDMIFTQQYALWNRIAILEIIKKIIGIKKFDEVIHSVHNYVDFNDFIIRKGAIASYLGQKMIIPLNMRDGILLCEGRSNIDWNNSAPHGAGRIMSRSVAKASIDLDKFKKSMKGIYSSSVSRDTLDESPFAYKNSKIIENAIEPTAIILDRIMPILSIKDCGKSETWKERREAKKQREIERDAERRMKRRR